MIQLNITTALMFLYAGWVLLMLILLALSLLKPVKDKEKSN